MRFRNDCYFSCLDISISTISRYSSVPRNRVNNFTPPLVVFPQISPHKYKYFLVCIRIRTFKNVSRIHHAARKTRRKKCTSKNMKKLDSLDFFATPFEYATNHSGSVQFLKFRLKIRIINDILFK